MVYMKLLDVGVIFRKKYSSYYLFNRIPALNKLSLIFLLMQLHKTGFSYRWTNKNKKQIQKFRMMSLHRL